MQPGLVYWYLSPCFSSLLLIFFIDFFEEGGLNFCITLELIMGLMSLSAFAILIFTSWKQKRAIQELDSNLSETKEALNNAQHQTKKLMGEFSKIIQVQFAEWNFTQTEKEVALLLLKGLSLDEIATVRETKEKTVRQQASNLYKKAKIAGRHELVAYFFEDLLIV